MEREMDFSLRERRGAMLIKENSINEVRFLLGISRADRAQHEIDFDFHSCLFF